MKLPNFSDFQKRFNDPLWLEIAAEICSEHNIRFSSLSRAEHGENIVVFIDDVFILKIYRPDRRGYERERTALKFVHGKISLPVPEIVAEGEIYAFNYLITDRMRGTSMLRKEWLKIEKPAQIDLLTQLAIGMKELHQLDVVAVDFNWNNFVANQIDTVMERQRQEGGNPEWLESLPKYLETNLPLLPQPRHNSFMHGDVHFGNLRVSDDRRPVITGLFDFADSLKGFHEYEFVAIGVLMIQGQRDLQWEFFRAYGYRDDQIDVELRRRMMLLTILYEHSSLRRYAERLSPDAHNFSLAELEKEIWAFS
jgi:hygromycin-B 7''-O-kinase